MQIDNHEPQAQWMSGASCQKRIALVTGRPDGIGKAIAHELAGQGMRVVIVGSNAVKSAAAASELREASGNDHIEFLRADLSVIRNVVGEPRMLTA